MRKGALRIRISIVLSALLLLLSSCLCVCAESEGDAEIIASGDCYYEKRLASGGEDLLWTLDALGKLTLSGSGSIPFVEDFEPSYMKMPWCDYREQIVTFETGDQVYAIDEKSLRGCRNLTSAVLGASVSYIGVEAFFNCEALKSIYLPVSLETVASSAFWGANALETVYYAGTEAEWAEVNVYANNDALLNAEIIFECAPSGSEAEAGNADAGEADAGDAADAGEADAGEMDAGDVDAGEADTGDVAAGEVAAGEATSAQTPSGALNNSVTWTLQSGVLAIEGTGEIPDYVYPTPDESPWYERREEIIAIRVGEGITAIGNYAFHNLPNLLDARLPSTLQTIGGGVFAGATSLRQIVIPDSVTFMSWDIFYDCHALESVGLSSGLAKISTNVFYATDSLEHIYIPENITDMAFNAFAKHSDALTIHGVAGSYAERYADNYGIPFSTESVPLLFAPEGSASSERFTLGGEVTLPTGEAISGVQVLAVDSMNADAETFSASTDDLGRWSMPDLPGGVEYRVTLRKEAYSFKDVSVSLTGDVRIQTVGRATAP